MSHNRLKNMLLDDSDSDEEEMMLAYAAFKEEQKANRRRPSSSRGSVQGHATIWRDRQQGHNRLFQDYFAEDAVYPPNLFRRRFRMRRSLFLRILAAVEQYDPYFIQKRDNAGIMRLSYLQKIHAAMRMLAYGVAADSIDDYVRIGESTTIESLQRFVKAVIVVFSEEYLRSPNINDVVRLLAVGESRGFPGMLGSIDCMHWKWKNCPTAWKSMYTGHIHEATIILEAVASYDLWIWHAFFGLLGSHNDINVLDRSPVFADLAEGRAAPCTFSINDHNYTMGYYLADRIYPPWSTLVKTISSPQGNKQKHFAGAQESARKDVERAFGVLQARFVIVRGPTGFWKHETLKDIMKACIIMHNMIVEDERDEQRLDFNFDTVDESPSGPVSHERTAELMEFISSHHHIRNMDTHAQLQKDLIEYQWEQYGNV